VITLLNDGAVDGTSMVCSMFAELAAAIVWGLAPLGVAGEAVCCQLHATSCWSNAAGATVPLVVAGREVRGLALGRPCRTDALV
jgi:hypothetical protein